MRPKLRLSRLRDLGWQLWDPIGLIDFGEAWDGKPFADEYDSYLVQAAGRLRRGDHPSAVVDYLVKIEAEHMGLGMSTQAENRARQLVDAIQNADDLWVIRDT